MSSKILLKALIVDDERSAIKNLSNLIQEFCPEIQVIGTARNVPEAEQFIRANTTIDLIFLDIEMPKQSGFELLKSLQKPVQVVFVTAYNQYAVKAFEVSAVDYLLKPILIKRLKQTAQKVIQNQKIQQFQLDALQENLQNKKLTNMILPYADTKIKIQIKDILYLEANSMYTIFHLYQNGGFTSKLFSGSLKKHEENLINNTDFLRIHRSYFLNVKAIQGYKKSSQKVVLINKMELPISRNNTKKFEEWFYS